MQITLTLAQCRTLYENHFKTYLPDKLPFEKAAQMVFREVDAVEFLIRLDALNDDGTYKKVNSEYDYKNQAWLVDGRYVPCNHIIENCKCFGSVHEGQTKEEAA
jgi:hypothetical protein